jgi:predicted amidohydrolase
MREDETVSEKQSHAVAVAQAHAIIDDIDQNLATVSRLMVLARENGAEVVVTPELFATGYAPERAWTHDGSAIRQSLMTLVSEHGIALVASTVDSDSSGSPHRIAASLFTPDGGELIRVHKSYLFGDLERQWMTPGESSVTPVAWRGSQWGLGICYDVEFPEFVRAQAAAGADILLVPTAVPSLESGIDGLSSAWHYSATQTSTQQVPTRALDHGVVIAYANHCGEGFTGRSCIATPYGHNAVQLESVESVGVVDVPMAAVARARSINTYLTDAARRRAFSDDE